MISRKYPVFIAAFRHKKCRQGAKEHKTGLSVYTVNLFDETLYCKTDRIAEKHFLIPMHRISSQRDASLDVIEMQRELVAAGVQKVFLKQHAFDFFQLCQIIVIEQFDQGDTRFIGAELADFQIAFGVRQRVVDVI